MSIDKKLFERLREDFAYFEEYDKFGGKPDKRVPVCITIPLRLKKKLEERGKANVSRFVENILEKNM